MTDEKHWSGLWSEPEDDEYVYGEKLMTLIYTRCSALGVGQRWTGRTVNND